MPTARPMQIKQRIKVQVDGDVFDAELRNGTVRTRIRTGGVVRDTVEIHPMGEDEDGAPPAVILADVLRAFLAAVDAVRE